MNKIIAVFLVALCMTVCVTAYSDGVQADLQDNLIRLHIIADSNECRDEIINDLNEFEDIANDVLRENGFSYTAHAEYGKFEFPEKTYKSMVLPAGEYYGVRIVLGSGEGHNWWCVMYPPLCFKEGEEVRLSKESEKILREKLDKDTYDIITKNDKEVVVKFKLVEIVQEIKQKINGD